MSQLRTRPRTLAVQCWIDEQDKRISRLESASVPLHRRNLRLLSREVLVRALQQAQNVPVAQGSKCNRCKAQFGKDATSLRAAALACGFEETMVQQFVAMCDSLITEGNQSAHPQPLKVLKEELKGAQAWLQSDDPVAQVLAAALPNETQIISAAVGDGSWWALG